MASRNLNKSIRAETVEAIRDQCFTAKQEQLNAEPATQPLTITNDELTKLFVKAE